jgi:serine/threonine protein kinase
VIDTGTLVLDGRFRVLQLLGAGGMGEVYLGEQVSLGRRVAIKVLHADLMVHPSMIERFKREARMLSAVEHPAVVHVIDYGQAEVGACLVMEYVEGENLYDVLQLGAMAPSRALPLLYQLAEGLAAIHDKGIIHRDLKPENVLLTKGLRGEQARLLDFGIARLVEPDAASSNLWAWWWARRSTSRRSRRWGRRWTRAATCTPSECSPTACSRASSPSPVPGPRSTSPSMPPRRPCPLSRPRPRSWVTPRSSRW